MKIFDKFFKNDLKKNAITLIGGTAVAQGINLVFYPILGRLYSPEEFGLFASLNMIVTILAVIGTLKYEDSILISPTKKDAINIAALCIGLSFIILSVVFFLSLFFSDYISELLEVKNLSKWLCLCPLCAFLFIIFNIYNEWCVRNKYFKYLSINKISNALSISLSKFFLGLVPLVQGGGLIAGDTIGRFFTAVTCAARGYFLDKDIIKYISYDEILKNAKTYVSFPKFYVADQLVNKLGQAAPIFMLGMYFSEKEVGYFSMTLIVLSLPINVIGVAIKDIFRQRASVEYYASGNCRLMFLKLFFLLLSVCVVVSLLVFHFLPDIFSLVLGGGWYNAGVYSQILLPMVATSFMNTSLSGVLVITKKLKQSMYWQFFYLISTVLSVYLGNYFFHNILYTLMFLAIGRCLANVIYMLMSYVYAKNTINEK